jgi:hypothetical protein
MRELLIEEIETLCPDIERGQTWKGNHSKYWFVCKVHGEYLQEYGAHQQGRRCPACGNIVHGQSRKTGRTPEYSAYLNARQRCRPSHAHHKYYYDRGIKFLFTSFAQFFAELGFRPSPEHQVDRIENKGNYEPGNVRWALKSVQMRNRTTSGEGVWKDNRKLKKPWESAIWPEKGKCVHLGYFRTKKEALAARRAAVKKEYPV